MTKQNSFGYDLTIVPKKQLENFQQLARKILDAFVNGDSVNIAPSPINKKAIEEALVTVESQLKRIETSSKNTGRPRETDESKLSTDKKNAYQREYMRRKRATKKANG